MMENIIARGVITAEQLKTLLNQSRKTETGIKLIDATFVLPGSDSIPHRNYLEKRLPGALFFDIEEIADKTSPLPHTAPTREIFESAASSLGLAPSDLLVIYGQTGMTMGPCRAWWTFRLFGHDRVCILDGGLPEWINSGGKLESGAPKTPHPTKYKAKTYRKNLICSQNDVKAACESKKTSILDARSYERYAGSAPEPRPGMRSGHIPGSLSVPASSLVNPETGTFKTDAEISEQLSKAGFEFSTAKPNQIITTCGSGITACVISLALFRIGFKETAVYDGSWAEWGQEKADNKISSLNQ